MKINQLSAVISQLLSSYTRSISARVGLENIHCCASIRYFSRINISTVEIAGPSKLARHTMFIPYLQGLFGMKILWPLKIFVKILEIAIVGFSFLRSIQETYESVLAHYYPK